MKIEENDFILETSNSSGNFWDLSFKKIVNKGKDNEREEWDKPLYGLPLDSALCRIVHYRTVNKLEGNNSTLKKYINTYQETWKDIKDIIKNNNL